MNDAITRHSVGFSRARIAAKRLLESMVSLLAAPAAVMPRFPSKLFYVSMLAGLVVMVVGAWIAANFGQAVFLPRAVWLDALTYYADPLLVQLLWTGVAVSIALMIALSARATYPNRQAAIARVVTTAMLPIGILIVSYMVGDLLFKPALNYDRPPGQMREPPFTALLRPALGPHSEGDAAPSGFVVRQVALFVGIWLMIDQPLFDVKPRRSFRTLLHIANIIVMVFVAFSRVYRRTHSYFDVSLSVGVGTVVVWTLVSCVYRASSRRYTHVSFTAVASNLALFAGLSYYANDFEQLVLSVGILLALYTVFFLLVECCGDASPQYPAAPVP